MADEIFSKPFTGNWILENVTINNEQLLLGQPGYAISEVWRTGAGSFYIFKNKYGDGIEEDLPDFDYRTSSDRDGITNVEWIPLITSNIISLGYVQIRIQIYESVSSSSRSSSSSSKSSSSSCKSSSSSSSRSSSSSCRSSSSSSSSSYALTYLFTESRPYGDTPRRWEIIATSDDGTKIIVAVDGARIHYSSDSGVSWVELQPQYPSPPTNVSWRSVAMSGDGSLMMANGSYYGNYVSRDGGGSWTVVDGYTVSGWGSLASNIDGTRLFSCGTYIYTSNDYGVSWVKRDPTGYSKWWYGLDCNSTGSFVVACYGGGAYDSNPDHYNYDGRIYTSTDYGVNWTERRPAGDVGYRWNIATCNSSGSFVMVCGRDSTITGNGRIYLSSDYGVNWTETRPAGNFDKAWYGLACNENGSILVAGMGAYEDYTLFVSTNGGTTWDSFPKASQYDYVVSLTSTPDMHKVYYGQGYGYIRLGTSTIV